VSLYSIIAKVEILDNNGDVARFTSSCSLSDQNGLPSKLVELFPAHAFVAVSNLMTPQTQTSSDTMFEWVIPDKHALPQVLVLPHVDVSAQLFEEFDIKLRSTYSTAAANVAKHTPGTLYGLCFRFLHFVT
jgi:hypothetical protein